MSNDLNYFLSFELEQEGRSLVLHGDAKGLKALAALLVSMADNTPDGYFDHEHLRVDEGISRETKGGNKINHVKIYCWRGDRPYGTRGHPLWKDLEDHGYSLMAVKEWRTHERDAGRPYTLEDFLKAHGLCAECGAHGVRFVQNANEFQPCSVCGGSGKIQ
jgi:hypothetical protein